MDLELIGKRKPGWALWNHLAGTPPAGATATSSPPAPGKSLRLAPWELSVVLGKRKRNPGKAGVQRRSGRGENEKEKSGQTIHPETLRLAEK